VVKVGLELFTAVGPDIVQQMIDDGYQVFLDLKLADIPNTVGRAGRVLGALGVSYLTMHAFVGPTMLRAGVEGLRDGAARAGLPEPTALAVTILTSDSGAPPHILGKRVATALEAGCRGVVCAAGDVREAKQLAPRLLTVVPGIRAAGDRIDDQARAATPTSAVSVGADLLVVGRAVTAAADRVKAAMAIAEEVGAALG
jgi:orotidine-5'-phosphate decarboxylase